jgi:hypothetical protein
MAICKSELRGTVRPLQNRRQHITDDISSQHKRVGLGAFRSRGHTTKLKLTNEECKLRITASGQSSVTDLYCWHAAPCPVQPTIDARAVASALSAWFRQLRISQSAFETPAEIPCFYSWITPTARSAAPDLDGLLAVFHCEFRRCHWHGPTASSSTKGR